MDLGFGWWHGISVATGLTGDGRAKVMSGHHGMQRFSINQHPWVIIISIITIIVIISLSFAFPRAGQSPSAGHLAAGKSAAGQASRAGGARWLAGTQHGSKHMVLWSLFGWETSSPDRGACMCFQRSPSFAYPGHACVFLFSQLKCHGSSTSSSKLDVVDAHTLHLYSSWPPSLLL